MLIIKSESKIAKISDASYENEVMILLLQCQHKVKVCSAYHLLLFVIALKLCFVTSHILVDLFVKHEKFHAIK